MSSIEPVGSTWTPPFDPSVANVLTRFEITRLMGVRWLQLHERLDLSSESSDLLKIARSEVCEGESSLAVMREWSSGSDILCISKSGVAPPQTPPGSP